MNTRFWRLLTVACFLLPALGSPAATLYVDLNSSDPTAPYSTWATAAVVIQDAVDAASPGDLILVTNGVYQSGGHVVYGVITNRVAVAKAITVQSVNGSGVTSIVGYRDPFNLWSDVSVRCVYLTNGATLSGFTLTNGSTQFVGDLALTQSGGGVWCESTNAFVSNCVLAGNTAAGEGAGAYQGTLNDCILTGNLAQSYGGGAYGGTLNGCSIYGNTSINRGSAASTSTLNNCTVVSNSDPGTITGSFYIPGLYFSTCANCIVFSNTSGGQVANYDTCTFNYSCTVPLPATGTGNFSADPGFADFPHLVAASPCRGTGSAAFASGLDLDGEHWRNPPSIGCEEFIPGTVTGSLTVSFQSSRGQASTNYPINFNAGLVGRSTGFLWDFGDGSVISNQLDVAHAWSAVGDYPVIFTAYNDTYPTGVSVTNLIHIQPFLVRYVSCVNANPAYPFTNWSEAATSIQDAVDAANPGDLVLVTNGAYQIGGHVTPPYSVTNRVAAFVRVTIQSVNGPAVTSIVGSQDFGGINGIRCVYLTNGASIIGFTLTNGGCGGPDFYHESAGAGVWCEAVSCVVSNCLIVGNIANDNGGGAYSGTLNNCILSNNIANTSGGGASGSDLNNCVVISNSTVLGFGPGGIVNGQAINCTIVSNIGGGADNSTLDNCIIYFNSGFDYSASLLNYCCVPSLPNNGGMSNITADPQLTNTFHISSTSPCIAAGNAGYTIGTDIDGQLWLNPPSIGCDEYYGAGPLGVMLQASSTNLPVGHPVSFIGQESGSPTSNSWNFGDGTIVTNRIAISHVWNTPGDYQVVLTAYDLVHPLGVSASVLIHVFPQPVHYVSLTSTNPVSPFLTWDTAATNIQDAINASSESDTVLVTNGVYLAGGYVAGGMTNRVAIIKPVTVQSVNGPLVTTISGYQVPVSSGGPYGAAAIRCAYLTNGAALAGFTLTNGAGVPNGGGVYCESTNSVVSNCTIVGNAAQEYGGGAYEGTLFDCSLVGNTGGYGGGAMNSVLKNCYVSGNTSIGVFYCTLYNCTVVSNVTGAFNSTFFNSIVYFNTNNQFSNYDPGSCTFSFCCTLPLPSSGVGNIAVDPGFSSPPQIFSNSPCVGAGSSAYAAGADLFGQAWLSPPSIGCVEYIPGNVTGSITVTAAESVPEAQTNLPINFSAAISGRSTSYVWDFGDGARITNSLRVSHPWSSTGMYPVVFTAFNDSNPGGVSVTNFVQIVTFAIRYVNASSANPVSPFVTWATAATKIQDAVDICQPGDVVNVTNGVYSQGGHPVFPSLLMNRVAITNQITVQSVNGPGVTTIQGVQVSGTIFGDSAVRCVYLTNGAMLAGFTLASGATRSAGDPILEQTGGGVFCASASAFVSNCLITGNAGYNYGGGASGGTVANSIFTGNTAHGSGGGAAGGIVNASYFYNNTSSGISGGGASLAALNNCTVISNSGGGISNCVAKNCIIDFNTGAAASNFDASSLLNYCCSAPLPAAGTGNIAVNPQLAASPHLLAASACRGAGNSAYSIGSDLDGHPWSNPPSIGCEEYEPGGVLGPLSVAMQASVTRADVMFLINFTGTISGQYSGFSWSFGDGTVVTNQFAVSHAWATPGTYPVVFTAFNDSNPGGISVTDIVPISAVTTHYVNLLSTNPQSPFNTWSTAATNIQDAVNSAVAGDTVFVTNGVYVQGGAIAPSQNLTNRVAVTIPITLQSVNGPAVTTIQGHQVPGTTNGSSAVRGVYLSDGAALIGFTVTGGATLGGVNPQSGGMAAGIWCTSSNAFISNCIIAGNYGFWAGGGIVGGSVYSSSILSNTCASNSMGWGGGAYQSQLFNCLVAGNQAFTTGGAYQSTLTSCIVSNNYAYGATYSTGQIGQGGGANLSTLYGCLLTGNSAANGGAAASSTAYNSVLTSNLSFSYGGGAYGGTLNNCLLTSNLAVTNGGGAYSGTLNNCTVISNTSSSGTGGVFAANSQNSIIFFNTSSGTDLENYAGGNLSWCDTFPLPSTGTGNISANPQLSGSYRLAAFSQCIGAGNSAYAAGFDLAGSPWRNPPSIGCYEFSGSGPLTVAVASGFTNIAAGFTLTLTGQVSGNIGSVRWDFGDGTRLSNSLTVSHAWNTPGTYTATLTANNTDNPGGVTGSIVIQVVAQPVLYVSQNNTNPVSPYSSWTTAATNIQDAVDASSVIGSLVLVSNGIYLFGGHAVAPFRLTNRVVVTNPLILLSANGPAVTTIQGFQVPGTSNGPGAVRGAWLCDGAVLGGFTLTLGATLTNGNLFNEMSGGGIGCATPNSVVSNCVVAGNIAYQGGGGVYGGSLGYCLLTSNILPNNGAGGGSLQSILNACVVSNNYGGSAGGGAAFGTLNNCVLAGNTAGSGGGAYDSSLNDCLLFGNIAGSLGGGANSCALTSCTVTGNSNAVPFNSSGGTYGSVLKNSIIYYNFGSFGQTANANGGTLNFCCTTPFPAGGTGNISAAPLFVNSAASNYHLQSNSPCINAGNDAYVAGAADLDGNPRISGGTVDIGAYEFQNPASIISYAWLQQYGLPTDGSADYADTDHNGMNNWQKWVAGLNPTNAASVLQMLSPTPSDTNLVVTWQSVTNISYFLQRSPSLAPGSFQPLATNIPGQTGTTSYTDTNAPAPGPWYYRVGVP